jgi:hypothetical protein
MGSGYRSHGLKRKRRFLGYKQYTRPSSSSPRPDEALLYGKWTYETSSVSAFRTVYEIDPRCLYSRKVDNIHVVLQASLTGYGGFLETDIVYTRHPLASADKDSLVDREAIENCLRPLYLRSVAPVSEVFQPEIDVDHCRLLGRRTVGLPASNGQASFSLQGIQPENNRWIIPFSSQLLDGHRFYIINRFLGPRDAKSVLQLWMAVSMYPPVAPGGLEIPPGNHHYERLLATQSHTASNVIDETEGSEYVSDTDNDC